MCAKLAASCLSVVSWVCVGDVQGLSDCVRKTIKLVYIKSVIVEWSRRPVAQLWVDAILFFLYHCIYTLRKWHYNMDCFLKLDKSWNSMFRELSILGSPQIYKLSVCKCFLTPKIVWILTFFRSGHVFYAICPKVFFLRFINFILVW